LRKRFEGVGVRALGCFSQTNIEHVARLQAENRGLATKIAIKTNKQ
jgi:hypothetical protein